MNAQPQPTGYALTDHHQHSVEQACQRIAPAWPLDRLIAVNPWWEMRDIPIQEVSAGLATLGGVSCLMPGKYYKKLWKQQIQPRHLAAAASRLGETTNDEVLLAYLEENEIGQPFHTLSGLLDRERDQQHLVAWREEIIHQISQYCASYFLPGGPFNADADAERGLYRDWLELTRQDRGIEILMAANGLREQFLSLPNDHISLLAQAIEELSVDDSGLADYLHALLLDINGWASSIAYRRWQATLKGPGDHGMMAELLAIRLAWDLALWRYCRAIGGTLYDTLRQQWRAQWKRLSELKDNSRQAQRLSWVWQTALELSYQESLQGKLLRAVPAAPVDAPRLQAAFCIDVRSEPMRRALEAQSDGIETIGFAGFFGLPLEYQPAGTGLGRPQLPGLLHPTLQVTDIPSASTNKRVARLHRNARWLEAQDAPPAIFSLVEAAGLRYAFNLAKKSLGFGGSGHPVNGLSQSGSWRLTKDGQPVEVPEQAVLAAGILRNMGLTGPWAPVVLLVGHGSETCNNPHAAGLDCGACGGQTGEVNVRVLAQILNDSSVREALVEHGIRIPDATRFVAALHNTTTDDIRCFDEVPRDIQGWLEAAGSRTRQERAPGLGITERDSDRQDRLIRKRTRDWSQVRPEWGLANNASFIVAPRACTRQIDLGGRCFLHDYDWRADPDYSRLELIMTAPMVVTHWINMQYNASVTDPQHYGSGNKVLHNVVGGNLGVFEGNGGDLRIGLPLQSVHDGQNWMHQPVRLSVYISAPQDAIADIVARHPSIAHLINNGWLYLFQWDTGEQEISRYFDGEWNAETVN